VPRRCEQLVEERSKQASTSVASLDAPAGERSGRVSSKLRARITRRRCGASWRTAAFGPRADDAAPAFRTAAPSGLAFPQTPARARRCDRGARDHPRLPAPGPLAIAGSQRLAHRDCRLGARGSLPWVQRGRCDRREAIRSCSRCPPLRNPAPPDTLVGLHGDVAEWLRSGLQSRLHRFDSGRRLSRVLMGWRGGSSAKGELGEGHAKSTDTPVEVLGL
jgi:hypothetical protein